MSTLTFLSKLHSISLMPLQRKTKKTGVKNTQAPKNSQFLSRPKRACEETNVTFWYKECSILTFDFWNSFWCSKPTFHYWACRNYGFKLCNHPPNCKHYNIESFSSNPLHPNISMHILHTVLLTFPKMPTWRICLTIKSLFSGWSAALFSWP